DARRARRVPPYQPADQMVATLEPEALFLGCRQQREILMIEAVVAFVEFRCQLGKPVGLGHRVATIGAQPCRRPKVFPGADRGLSATGRAGSCRSSKAATRGSKSCVGHRRLPQLFRTMAI